jgi:enoyl-[acyl-carrier protein] reductase II
MALGAEGVQIGSRFVCSEEATSHPDFKKAVIAAGEGDTALALKKLTPVRLLKNRFYEQVHAAEERCAPVEELQQILGRARAKKGMFEGELEAGELEIGQVSSIINEIKPAAAILSDLWQDFAAAAQNPFGYCS